MTRTARYAAAICMAVVSAPALADGFVAHLSGGQEVPPVETRAQGQAKVSVNDDGSGIDFRLAVAGLQNITQAHIHCGAEGVNGPVVLFLFGFVSGGVTLNGILAEGSASGADVIPRPDSAACPGGVADLEDLVAKMEAGEAYVNVHTIQNPGGEIRGQLRGAE